MPEIGPIVDLTIIGGGPTGLFGAFYAGLRHMSVRILDSLPALGGQLTALYPEKYIYDVAGFPKILGKDLAANLVEQAMQYHPAVRLGDQVRALHQLSADSDGAPSFELVTDRDRHRTRALLVASGIGAMAPKSLPLSNAAEYEGKGLYYSVRQVSDMAGKRILIVGGGDSAVDWANTLCGITSQQTLIHRRDVFRAHEDSVARMTCGPTRVLVFHELTAIGGQGRIEWATITDSRTRQSQTISIDAVLVNIGFSSSLGPIREWGLELDGNAIRVDSMMRTSRPGIFAAGDVATYPGKLKLIATGFAEACTAVNFAKTWLDPTARAFPGHSTEMAR